jgi:hypothetical protein
MKADPSRVRISKRETLRCLFTPVGGAGFGGCDEVSPGHLAPGEIGTLLVGVGTFVKEPRSGSGQARAKLPRQRLT